MRAKQTQRMNLSGAIFAQMRGVWTFIANIMNVGGFAVGAHCFGSVVVQLVDTQQMMTQQIPQQMLFTLTHQN
jgi:hypothetical protein